MRLSSERFEHGLQAEQGRPGQTDNLPAIFNQIDLFMRKVLMMITGRS
jgi:hypothetical protein